MNWFTRTVSKITANGANVESSDTQLMAFLINNILWSDPASFGSINGKTVVIKKMEINTDARLPEYSNKG